MSAGRRAFVVCAAGASGACVTRRLLFHLLRHPGAGSVHFVSSEAFGLVLEREEGLSLPAFLKALPGRKKLAIYKESQLDAPIASGSFRVDGTVIVPASMAAIGALASGAGDGLVHRAGDVALKEGRKLILVPRETPLSLVHLRNLVALKEAGAEIFPFIPAFYLKPSSVEELVDHFLMRILDHLGLENDISPRWMGGSE